MEPEAGLTDHGYTGHKQQDAVGLIYMRARYYVPGVGRFASADTIAASPGDPQQLNGFSYARNNALRYRDPTGHCIFEEYPFPSFQYADAKGVIRSASGDYFVPPGQTGATYFHPTSTTGGEAIVSHDVSPLPSQPLFIDHGRVFDEALEGSPDVVGARFDVTVPVWGDLNINLAGNRRSTELGLYISSSAESLTAGSAATGGVLVAWNCPTNSCMMGSGSVLAGADVPLLVSGLPVVVEGDLAVSSPNDDGSIPVFVYLGVGSGVQAGAYQSAGWTPLGITLNIREGRLSVQTDLGVWSVSWPQ